MTFILLFIPSTFAVDILQSYHARIPLLWAAIVFAIFIILGSLLSFACLIQSSRTIPAYYLVISCYILFRLSFR